MSKIDKIYYIMTKCDNFRQNLTNKTKKESNYEQYKRKKRY